MQPRIYVGARRLQEIVRTFPPLLAPRQNKDIALFDI